VQQSIQTRIMVVCAPDAGRKTRRYR